MRKIKIVICLIFIFLTITISILLFKLNKKTMLEVIPELKGISIEDIQSFEYTDTKYSKPGLSRYSIFNKQEDIEIIWKKLTMPVKKITNHIQEIGSFPKIIVINHNSAKTKLIFSSYKDAHCFSVKEDNNITYYKIDIKSFDSFNEEYESDYYYYLNFDSNKLYFSSNDKPLYEIENISELSANTNHINEEQYLKFKDTSESFNYKNANYFFCLNLRIIYILDANTICLSSKYLDYQSGTIKSYYESNDDYIYCTILSDYNFSDLFN